MSPEDCPNCGAEVPRGARSCPECGADENTGWNEDATAQRLGIPVGSFDYDEFIDEEFGSPKRRGLRWYWVTTGVILLLCFLWVFLR